MYNFLVSFFYVCELQVRELKAKLLRDESNETEKEESPISSGVVKEEISNVDDSSLCFNGSYVPSTTSSMINLVHYYDSRGSPEKIFQNHFMRMEEQNFFSVSELCNFFSVDQSPTL